jgi:hypothetical protein
MCPISTFYPTVVAAKRSVAAIFAAYKPVDIQSAHFAVTPSTLNGLLTVMVTLLEIRGSAIDTAICLFAATAKHWLVR